MSTTENIVILYISVGVATAIFVLAFNLLVKKENRLSIEEIVLILARFSCSKPVIVTFMALFAWIILKRF